MTETAVGTQIYWIHKRRMPYCLHWFSCFHIARKKKSLEFDIKETCEPSMVLHANTGFVKWAKKKKAGTEVWFGRSADELPSKKVGQLEPTVFTSYSGPDKGLALVPELSNGNITDGNITENGDSIYSNSNTSHNQCNADQQNNSMVSGPYKGHMSTADDIAGAHMWNVKSRKAYGIAMSLYDQHPINGKISGDPIADAFGVCARENSAVLIVADGVNWGEKSKLAARCATYGCMKYVNDKLFGSSPVKNTREAFALLLNSLEEAHSSILENNGGLTTLCVALVCPLLDSKQFAVCIVNVGDSLAYVLSKYHGVREITTGSHDIQSERDIRDAGGALGPVNGKDPELHNLTCSMTIVDPGDIIYLTTDGISDNFDPVVTKIAVAKRRFSDSDMQANLDQNGDHNRNGERPSQAMFDGKPEMIPHERHQYAVKEMERIIHEFELFTEQPCSAQELCGALLQHVLKLTDPKRKVLENPDLYGKKLRSKDRKRRDSEIMSKLSKSPGKLDHATIIAYEVGVYHGNDDEDYEEQIDEELANQCEQGMNSGTADPIAYVLPEVIPYGIDLEDIMFIDENEEVPVIDAIEADH